MLTEEQILGDAFKNAMRDPEWYASQVAEGQRGGESNPTELAYEHDSAGIEGVVENGAGDGHHLISHHEQHGSCMMN